MLPAAPGSMKTGGLAAPGFIVTQPATGKPSSLAMPDCTQPRAARTLRNSWAVPAEANWSVIDLPKVSTLAGLDCRRGMRSGSKRRPNHGLPIRTRLRGLIGLLASRHLCDRDGNIAVVIGFC